MSEPKDGDITWERHVKLLEVALEAERNTLSDKVYDYLLDVNDGVPYMDDEDFVVKLRSGK